MKVLTFDIASQVAWSIPSILHRRQHPILSKSVQNDWQWSSCFRHQIKSNQIFHYTRCNTPKRVTSWWGPSPRHCARATQLLSKICRSGGEPLATLCPIWPARDLNLRPPAPETNVLPLDKLAGLFSSPKSEKYCSFLSAFLCCVMRKNFDESIFFCQ